MAFRLPPLNGLRIFEAAARNGSFKMAAEELHITPSAVSHGIDSLEKWLGSRLFDRGSRGLTLSPTGEAYYPLVSRALALLAEATERLPGRRATGSLSVSSSPTIANRWLLPRLHRFTETHPDIRVTLDTSQRQIDLPFDGIDLALRMSPEAKAGGRWIRLMQEVLVPVCSPDLYRQLSGMDAAQALAHAPLIHVTAISADWDEWFRGAGVDCPPGAASGLRVDTVQMALEAAAQGLGIALGRRPLIDQDLESGRLVQIPAPQIVGKISYWLVGAAAAFERPEIKLFRRWLISEIGEPPLGVSGPAHAPSGPGPAKRRRATAGEARASA